MSRNGFQNGPSPACEIDDYDYEDELEGIIRDLSEREMRELLRTLADEDEAIGRRIVNEFGTPDAGRTQAGLNADIAAIWNRYEYKGYVSYYHSSDFEREMHEALWNAVSPLIRPKTLLEAFEVTYAFLLRLEDIEIDDSNGFFSSMTDLCADRWREILSLAPLSPNGSAVRRTVCNRLCSFIRKNPVRDRTGVYSFLSDEVTDFLMESFTGDVELASELLDLIDGKLADSFSPKGDELGLPDYERARWAALRLKVMEGKGAAIQERMDFAKPYLHHRDIRMIFVEEARSRGDAEKAIALLLEGRALRDDTRGQTAFAKELAELYKETGKVDLACAEMRTLVQNERGHGGRDTHWFEKLKDLTPEKEWLAVRGELLASMVEGRCRRSCLAVEGLYDELMSNIENDCDSGWSDNQLSEVRRFRTKLGPLFPERVASIYRKGVEDLLSGYNTNRKTYQHAMVLMGEMAKAGGNAEAAELAESIRTKYPRRRALMDELRKAGW